MIQIQKMDYKEHHREKGKERVLKKVGYCYMFIWSQNPLRGFKIPFTLRITEVLGE